MEAIEAKAAELRAMLATLQGRVTQAESELDAPHSQDWEDLAQERSNDEVLQGIGSSGQREIAMITAALGRIDAGTYGVCTRCGEHIDVARLDALPHTPLCKVCAAEVQKDARS